ncbi:indolepyruvate ferredoxin oxidoreductase family protein [Sabulicella glaciei]|uniref:Indolepyruvate ferredoxin oxidoreductase family protein n=1 Tax=Sabulicella glaciei TaxID=2984948 RepID=A0ABT3NSK6_9PROT|nr:indolepyruvate ferredoxin oxidoreductase family protein [Roseococcus sp. MDT2-1-1]MCW8085153.1 indolepyruvate ferredoxin oxidoreductase family protein [Roseococcus sp. MDT2-1-1]
MGSIQRTEASLEERWDAAGRETLLTGTQALVRVPLIRRQLDAAQGHDTAGFISGYRGSPLGVYDKELWKQRDRLREARIHFEPGLNEDLAATACWGTQQVGLLPGAKQDGVFAIWYGKGPGVDRSGDVLRHANGAGTAPLGGVLALAGDDPASKSSTVTSGSEHAFADLEMPMLDPADVAEVLEYGVKAIALSRFAGTWVGMKCIAETMDATMSLVVDPAAFATTVPGEPGDVHIRLKDAALAIEQRLRHVKLPAAQAFARLNGFDRLVQDSPTARFGIAVRGKAWSTLRQALSDAGITPELARMGGLRIWKVGLAWPLDREGAIAFARGLEEVLVVEDRRAFLESQLREALYDLPVRPRLTGKDVLSDLAELDVASVLRALAARLPEALRTERLAARIAELDALAASDREPVALRTPFFCPGCPHNTSTRVPEGSMALAGIGCHYLAKDMDRNSDLFTHMGGEGAPWIGQQHFTETKHVFANMGDGTYSHSGSLAIRAAVAAKANMTFKVLVNSAVAMTGGQAPDAEVTVPRIAAQAAAEGVERIAIVGDDPDRHRDDATIPRFASFHDRAELDAVQRELREAPGVSVLIYDQQCATERRRQRKRGLAAPAARRAAINPRVCEDCGDCSRVSNCIAVEPVETPWGRKRRIDQSACNQDLSCVQGFCPSFVTLEGAQPRKPAVREPAAPPPLPELPEAEAGQSWNLLLAGVGGQGVTALAQILAMAAHLEGRPVRTLDMLGLAQKGGGVYVQMRIGRAGEQVLSPRIGPGEADAVIAADLIGAQGRVARPMLGRGRSRIVVSADVSPTGAFVLNPETRQDPAAMLDSLRAASREVVALPAAQEVEESFGDLIFLNVFLLGAAFQRGMVPLSRDALRRAIEMNGAAVERNLAAFEAGRLAEPAGDAAPETLEDLIARREADLVSYQSRRYAARYAALMRRVVEVERSVAPDSDALTREVARQLYRVMAIKDEYEVARLHADTSWITERFEGTPRLHFHLAPPALGEGKREFGPWMLGAMRLLRHGKALRGTALDPFGHSEERREERALREEFIAGLEAHLARLSPGNHAALVEWVREWGGIKGFGPVKRRFIEAARPRIAEAERRFLAA